MPQIPYKDASGKHTLTTLGKNPIKFSYVDGCRDTNFYPPADCATVFGGLPPPSPTQTSVTPSSSNQ